MTLNFRRATPADAETIFTLMREFYAFEHLKLIETAARQTLIEILANESRGQIWLIYANANLAGYVILTFGFSLEFHGRYGLIDELFLRAEMRGRGYGTRVLDFLGEQCRAAQIKTLRLEVEKANAPAYHLYQKNGFATHERFLMTKWLDK